jgi:hypothetical protein
VLRDRHIALANELRSLQALGSVVVALQPCIGSTGDDTPIHLNTMHVLNKTAGTHSFLFSRYLHVVQICPA